MTVAHLIPINRIVMSIRPKLSLDVRFYICAAAYGVFAVNKQIGLIITK